MTSQIEEQRYERFSCKFCSSIDTFGNIVRHLMHYHNMSKLKFTLTRMIKERIEPRIIDDYRK